MVQAKKKGKSPYAKYAKRPYVYSQLYQDWSAARAAGRDGEAGRLGREHSGKHGLFTRRGRSCTLGAG